MGLGQLTVKDDKKTSLVFDSLIFGKANSKKPNKIIKGVLIYFNDYNDLPTCLFQAQGDRIKF